jgi:hypothetical protein
MILETMLNGALSVVNWFFGFLPDINIPGELISAIATLYNVWSETSFIIPYSAILQCLMVVIGIYVIEFVVSSSSWVIRKIPTVS